MTDVIKEEMIAVEKFDVLSSSADVKAAGIKRFQDHGLELMDIKDTGSRLFRIHELITPDITGDQLPQSMRENMMLSFMILDRPDLERVETESRNAFKEVGKSIDNTKPINKRYLYFTVRQNLADRLAKFTTLKFDPGIKGALRSYGSRKIEGFPEEPVVYASHMLEMSGTAQNFMIALVPGAMVFPDAYYGLSTGLKEVFTKLCDSYDKLIDVAPVFKEAYFQVLGTRLIHPFWDGNGRGFAGLLSTSLEKMGNRVEFDRIMSASGQLGKVGDKMVTAVLDNARLALTSDSDPSRPLHLMMLINPQMRRDYMERLKAEIERAITIAKEPGNDYYDLVKQGENIISKTLQLNH